MAYPVGGSAGWDGEEGEEGAAWVGRASGVARHSWSRVCGRGPPTHPEGSGWPWGQRSHPVARPAAAAASGRVCVWPGGTCCQRGRERRPSGMRPSAPGCTATPPCSTSPPTPAPPPSSPPSPPSSLRCSCSVPHHAPSTRRAAPPLPPPSHTHWLRRLFALRVHQLVRDGKALVVGGGAILAKTAFRPPSSVGWCSLFGCRLWNLLRLPPVRGEPGARPVELSHVMLPSHPPTPTPAPRQGSPSLRPAPPRPPPPPPPHPRARWGAGRWIPRSAGASSARCTR